MGKKNKSGGEDKKQQEGKAKAFVLKVAMHCSCNGCIDKIRAAVRDMTLLQGIESWDQSALESKGELKLVATADPERLRQRLHKATRKNVDLIFFPSKDNNKDGSKQQGGSNSKASGGGTDAAAAAAQALLLNTLLQQQQQQGQFGHNAWGNQMMLPGAGAGGGWNTHGDYAYAPWAVQQQVPDPYATYSYPAAAGGAAWGGYAYPPALGHSGAWQGHGY